MSQEALTQSFAKRGHPAVLEEFFRSYLLGLRKLEELEETPGASVASLLSQVLAAMHQQAQSSNVQSTWAPTMHGELSKSIEVVKQASRSLRENFDDHLARIQAHTELCRATRHLRQISRRMRETPFYQALLEIDDCVRSASANELDRELVAAISLVADDLGPGIEEEVMLRITENLLRAGWRPLARR